MVFRINNCIFAFKLVLIHYPDVNNIIHSPLNSHLIMRNSHIRLAILLMAICCFCFPLDALSQKDSKKAKKEKVQYRQLPKMTEVSEMVSASRPDRPGADIRKPVLFGGRRVGILGKAGIDVSHYQGRINWYEVARDQKVTFVIMKATESDDFVDETYDYNGCFSGSAIEMPDGQLKGDGMIPPELMQGEYVENGELPELPDGEAPNGEMVPGQADGQLPSAQFENGQNNKGMPNEAEGISGQQGNPSGELDRNFFQQLLDKLMDFFQNMFNN